MRLKARKKCIKCEKTLFTYWHSGDNGEKICSGCFERKPESDTEQEVQISLHCEEKLPDEISDSEIAPDEDENDPTANVNEENVVFSIPMSSATKMGAFQYTTTTVNNAETYYARKPTMPCPPPNATVKSPIPEELSAMNSQNMVLMPSPIKRLRKSTRAARNKVMKSSQRHVHSTGQTSRTAKLLKNRRLVMKRSPEMVQEVKPRTRFRERVAHNGSYIQVGDIVSVVDRPGDVYYAQVRCLLVDQFEEKSAVLTWLLPTQESPSPKECFHPATYIIGPDEDFPRKLSSFKFVMHAPSDYYFDRKTPYPVPDFLQYPTNDKGYTWTRLPLYNVEKEDNGANVDDDCTDAAVA